MVIGINIAKLTIIVLDNLLVLFSILIIFALIFFNLSFRRVIDVLLLFKSFDFKI